LFTTFLQEIEAPFDPILNEEHDDWIWAPRDDTPEPLHPGLEKTLDTLRAAGVIDAEYEEGKHPRGEHGHWSESGAIEKFEPEWSRISDLHTRARAQISMIEWTSGDYEEINAALRDPWDAMEWAYGKEQSKIRGMDRAFEAAKPLSEDAVVYRGFGSGYLAGKEIKEGDEFIDRGFIATTDEPELAEQFIGMDKSEGYLCEIHVPKGTKLVAPIYSGKVTPYLRSYMKKLGVDPEDFDILTGGALLL
jgi:ADP-ribosyltransferase exoenzyme